MAAPSTGVPAHQLILAAPFPNPTNGTARISWSMDERARVRLDLIDVAGRRVAVLLDEERSPGFHDISWSGRDARGHVVPSGTYFVRIRAGSRVAHTKLVKSGF